MRVDGMKVALMTREYPPEVYGGAGVHVEYLARELRAFEDVTVHALGRRRTCRTRRGTRWRATRPSWPRCAPLSIDLTMAAGAQDADIVHTPHLVRAVRRAPGEARVGHPARRHRALAGAAAAVEGGAARRRLPALELLRATALENADAVIAVSNGTKGDILRVYPDDRPRPRPRDLQRDRHRRVHARPGHRRAREVRHRPGQAVASSSSAGSRARRASRTCSRRPRQFDPSAQLVLCAGSADTPELGAEVERAGGGAARPRARACSGSSRCSPSPR